MSSMATVSRSVRFKSSIPDVWQFDDNGDIVTPGSRELAERIVVAIREQGVETKPIYQYEYFGWEFLTKFDRATFENVLNPGDECYFGIGMDWYLVNLFLLRSC